MIASPVQPLIDAAALQTRIRELAAEIRHDSPAVDLHFICVLKGAFLFLADLVRAIDGGVTVDFITLSSYAGVRSSGEVRVVKDLDTGIEGRDVVIVEDVVDTGLTLRCLQDILRARRPRRLRTACLLSKPTRRRTDVTVDYVGFTINNHFVVGYGLDHEEHYRNLPYVGILR